VALLAKVTVTPKPVVNDPQGVTVRGGLEHLGFAEVRDVRVGKYIEIRLDAPSAEEARRRVEEMCRRLLANHVIEDFHFEISEADIDHLSTNGDSLERPESHLSTDGEPAEGPGG